MLTLKLPLRAVLKKGLWVHTMARWVLNSRSRHLMVMSDKSPL